MRNKAAFKADLCGSAGFLAALPHSKRAGGQGQHASVLPGTGRVSPAPSEALLTDRDQMPEYMPTSVTPAAMDKVSGTSPTKPALRSSYPS